MLLLFFACYILYVIFKKTYLPKLIGRAGERRVARTLRRLNTKDYRVYNDIYINNGGHTSQIDHLIISIYGIFVIETKNYKGWIFGNDRAKFWTQTLFKRKHKIYNPVLQNWGHVNSIKRISYEFKKAMFFPIVVFTGSAELKKINSSVPVIKRYRLIRTIRRCNEVYLTHKQLSKLEYDLQNSIVSGNEVRKQHNRNVKKRIKSKRTTKTSTCPKCGGRLVEKNGKYGRFQGCSNFPTCKFTRKVR